MVDINTYVFHKKYGIGQIKQIESKSVDVYATASSEDLINTTLNRKYKK